MSRRVVVIDTNRWISAYFFPDGVPATAVRIAPRKCTVAYSKDTIDELEDVLSRSRFDRFAPLEERLSFTGSVAASGQFMDVAYQFHACEDPKDDKFLDLAYAAGTDCIISGDGHLRTLKHFMGIQIWSPAQFVARERRAWPGPASRTQRD